MLDQRKVNMEFDEQGRCIRLRVPMFLADGRPNPELDDGQRARALDDASEARAVAYFNKKARLQDRWKTHHQQQQPQQSQQPEVQAQVQPQQPQHTDATAARDALQRRNERLVNAWRRPQ